MSVATFKKKTAAKYNNASVGQPQFSINGTRRLQGFVGQNLISRSFPRTLMRGNTERGYGGCCGQYYKCDPISPLCAGDFTNDPTKVKKSVVSTSGQLEMQYPPQDFLTVKPDNNQNLNTSQQYTLLQGAKTANKVKQYCKNQENPDLITLRLDFDTPENTYAYILISYYASQLQPIAQLIDDSIPNIPSWIKNITLYVNNGTDTFTYTNLKYILVFPSLPIDYTQSNLLNQFGGFTFGDTTFTSGYNYATYFFSMYLGDLEGSFDIVNISLVSGNPYAQIPQENIKPQQHTSCSDPILRKMFTSNTNPQQRSKKCPTFTTKDVSFYTSVSSSEYTQSLQQQTACSDALKLPQARVSNSPPFGATVQEQPTFDPAIANHYEPFSRNFYLNSVKRLRCCNPSK